MNVIESKERDPVLVTDTIPPLFSELSNTWETAKVNSFIVILPVESVRRYWVAGKLFVILSLFVRSPRI